MISLSDPSLPHDRTLLEAPGGFLWWYLDLVDENGDGVVLIWGFGLPFLPGITETPEALPADRPSLNVCVYQGGACTLWLLQEYGPDEVLWEPWSERCVFGDSTLESRRGRTVCTVDAAIDCPLPGTRERLTGRLRVEGPPVRHGAATPGDHGWTPLLTGAVGEVDLRVGDRPLASMRGRVYHDRNGSRRPLHHLGIDHWIWGRATQGPEERIWYLLWPEGGGPPRAIGLAIGADGVMQNPFDLAIALEEPRSATWGLPWWRRVVLTRDGAPWLTVTHQRPVEDGPFYLRFPVRVAGPEGDGVGFGEAVRPDRVDMPWFRPFVRMRVHRPSGPNAPLVSWFTGARRGRVARLLGAAL